MKELRFGGRPVSGPAETRSGGLWSTFRRLSIERPASCVGISKAVLLLTDGRIGPSLDSRVRAGMRIERFDLAGEWLTVLTGVSEDIRAFAQATGMSIQDAAPEAFRHLAPGRLYDMAFGPRERRRPRPSGSAV